MRCKAGRRSRPIAGQRDGSRVAVEQAHAQGVFEVANLNRERRLRDMQDSGRAGEAAKLGDDGEGPHLADIRIHKQILLL